MSEVQLPALGESVTEGTITRWLKNVGDTVEVDEPLVEVSTDKVDTEIPSPVAGVLQEIRAQEDDTVEVGAVLAIIGEGAAAESAPAAPAAEPAAEAPAEPEPAPVEEVTAAPVAESPAPPAAPAPIAEAPAAPVAAPTPPAPPVAPAAPVAETSAAPAAPAEPNDSDANYVTPIVRKLAKDNGVDLSKVKGSGIGGRIRKEDVEAMIGSAPSATQADSPAAPAKQNEVEVSPLRGTTEKMSRLRKVLASKAVESMQSSAQLTTVVEVDVTKIAELRKKIQADFTSKTGVKLSFMPFFNLAAAEALKSNPKINSTIEDETIVHHPNENISFAVETDRGLLTPVIRDAAELTIAETAQQIAHLAERTRNNQLTPDELTGGTFTLTNTGSRGALFDTPVVFLPQSAILGTGIVTKRPVVMQTADGSDVIAIRSMVYLALSYDHRNIDGADAARYLTTLKSRLEEGAFEGQLGI